MLSEQEVDRAAIAAYSRYRELSPNRRIETVEWVYLNKHDRNDWRDSAQAAVEAVLTQRTDGATDGAALIAAERKRQIESEKWTAEHDDEHDAGQLVEAAVTYALEATYDGPATKGTWFKKYWPWDDEWFKPKNPPQDLIRAGALIAAEIDRLQRATQHTEPAPAQQQDAAMEAVRYAQSEQGRQIAHDHPDGATRRVSAQEHLGRDRTDEWESRMDAQKQAVQPVPQSAGTNSSGSGQINVPQCTAPVQQSVGAEDVVERMAIAGRNAVDTCTVGNMLNLGWTQAMTAALAVARPVIEAEARKGLHSEAEIEKALQDEVEQWPGYESWYKSFTKNVLARLSPHKEELVTVEKEMR